MSNHTKHDEHSHNPSKFEAEALPNVSSRLTDTDDIQTPIRILQMDCPTEEGLLRTKLGGMPGVTMLEFNLMQRLLTVTHAPQAIEPILAAVRSLGLTPELANDVSNQNAPLPEPAKPWWPLALAGAAAIASEAVEWANWPTWLAAVLALVAVSTCGITTYKKGWIAIRNGNLNINALMSIAVTGAFFLGQWPEAAMGLGWDRIIGVIEVIYQAMSMGRPVPGGLSLATPRAMPAV